MKVFAVLVLLMAIVTIVGCGDDNHPPQNINGNWTATLTDTAGNPAFGFTTTLVTNSDGSLTASNFTFTTSSSCFVSGETQTGQFTFSGNTGGIVTGTFQFTITSGTPSGNTLSMSGDVSGNTITGTWTLTGGTGCTGNGNFTMTKA